MNNTQQKESGLLHLLLECVNIINNIKTPIKNLDIFKHNFKSLYNDVNNLDILNESEDSFNRVLSHDQSKPNITTNLQSNVYVHLKKSLDYINTVEAPIIRGLNESLKPLNESTEDRYDISSFKLELNKVLENLKNQDDTKTIPQDILKIKTSLQSSISVSRLVGTQLGVRMPSGLNCVP